MHGPRIFFLPRDREFMLPQMHSRSASLRTARPLAAEPVLPDV
jgi:hypothetical protein